MPLRNAAATKNTGIGSSVQSSKKFSAATKRTSAASATEKITSRTTFMSAPPDPCASPRLPAPVKPEAQTHRAEEYEVYWHDGGKGRRSRALTYIVHLGEYPVT